MFACMKIGLMCKVYQPEWSILVYRRAGMHEKGSAPLKFVWQAWRCGCCMHAWTCIHQSTIPGIFSTPLLARRRPPPPTSTLQLTLIRSIQPSIDGSSCFFILLNFKLISASALNNELLIGRRSIKHAINADVLASDSDERA